MAIIQPRFAKKKLDGTNNRGPSTANSLGTPNTSGSGGFSNPTGGLAPNNASRSSSGFTNIDRYKTANEGRSQSLVDDTVNKVKSNFDNSLVSNIQNKANQELNKNNPLSDINQFTNQIDSGNFSNIDKDAFNKALNSSFDGPSGIGDIEGFDEAQEKSNEYLTNAERLNNLDTRGSLIRDAYNDGNYTRGGGNLDSFLFNQGDLSEIGGVLDQAKGQTEALEGFGEKFSTDIEDRKTSIEESVKSLGGEYEETLKERMDAIREKSQVLNQDNADLSAEHIKLQNSLNTPDGWKNFDLDRDGTINEQDKLIYDTLTKDYNIDWLKSLNDLPELLQLGDTVSQQEQDELNALLNLQDRSNPFIFEGTGNEEAGISWNNNFLDNALGVWKGHSAYNDDAAKDALTNFFSKDSVHGKNFAKNILNQSKNDLVMNQLGYTGHETVQALNRMRMVGHRDPFWGNMNRKFNEQYYQDYLDSGVGFDQLTKEDEGYDRLSHYLFSRKQAQDLNDIVARLGGTSNFIGNKNAIAGQGAKNFWDFADDVGLKWNKGNIPVVRTSNPFDHDRIRQYDHHTTNHTNESKVGRDFYPTYNAWEAREPLDFLNYLDELKNKNNEV